MSPFKNKSTNFDHSCSKATEKKVTLNGAYPGFNTYFKAVVVATFFGGTVAIHV